MSEAYYDLSKSHSHPEILEDLHTKIFNKFTTDATKDEAERIEEFLQLFKYYSLSDAKKNRVDVKQIKFQKEKIIDEDGKAKWKKIEGSDGYTGETLFKNFGHPFAKPAIALTLALSQQDENTLKQIAIKAMAAVGLGQSFGVRAHGDAQGDKKINAGDIFEKEFSAAVTALYDYLQQTGKETCEKNLSKKDIQKLILGRDQINTIGQESLKFMTETYNDLANDLEKRWQNVESLGYIGKSSADEKVLSTYTRKTDVFIGKLDLNFLDSLELSQLKSLVKEFLTLVSGKRFSLKNYKSIVTSSPDHKPNENIKDVVTTLQKSINVHLGESNNMPKIAISYYQEFMGLDAKQAVKAHIRDVKCLQKPNSKHYESVIQHYNHMKSIYELRGAYNDNPLSNDAIDYLIINDPDTISIKVYSVPTLISNELQRIKSGADAGDLSFINNNKDKIILRQSLSVNRH